MAAMAASLETRVRVDRLLKLMAMVWPRRAEQMGACFERGFMESGILNQGGEFGRGEVGDCEQMAGSGGAVE